MAQNPDSPDFSELRLIEALDAENVHPVSEDSIAGPPFDSIAPLPFDTVLDTLRIQTYLQTIPTDTTSVIQTPAAPPEPWQNGLEPRPRFIHPAANSGFLLTLAVVLIIGAFNIRNLSHVVVTSAKELVKVRIGRDNVFDELSAGDARLRIFLLLLSIASGGLFLATGAFLLNGLGAALTVSAVVKYIALFAIYCTGMYVAYQTVGYTFAPGDGRREWVRGYTASLILSGVILGIPAVVAVFYPAVAPALAIGALAVFITAKLLFIIKGFRIFYDKIIDLVYFILYLCTLEIIPLLVMYYIAMFELI